MQFRGWAEGAVPAHRADSVGVQQRGLLERKRGHCTLAIRQVEEAPPTQCNRVSSTGWRHGNEDESKPVPPFPTLVRSTVASHGGTPECRAHGKEPWVALGPHGGHTGHSSLRQMVSALQVPSSLTLRTKRQPSWCFLESGRCSVHRCQVNINTQRGDV